MINVLSLLIIILMDEEDSGCSKENHNNTDYTITQYISIFNSMLLNRRKGSVKGVLSVHLIVNKYAEIMDDP